ncbi:MAG: hypothetical protein KFW09_02920 [Oscillospiraceae bacterium]|nr:hypothetical protein [Oscillospiraceae bacterium]
MKRYLPFLISLIYILSLNKVFADEYIELDPSAFIEKKEAYSSITDIYRIPVFFDEYIEKVEYKNYLDIEEKNNIIKKTFEKESIKKDEEYYFRDKIIEYNLFNSVKNNPIVKKEEDSAKNKYNFIILLICFLSVFITYLLTNKYYILKFKKENSYDNYSNV